MAPETSPDPAFQSADVAAAFAAFPASERAGLLALRALIFQTAADTPEVGPLHETLKWGQPAYLTAKTRSGTTIRLGCPKAKGPEAASGVSGGLSTPGAARFALYVHCQTTLMSDFRQIFGAFEGGATEVDYDGNRAIVFQTGAAEACDVPPASPPELPPELPVVPLTALIRSALTYHL